MTDDSFESLRPTGPPPSSPKRRPIRPLLIVVGLIIAVVVVLLVVGSADDEGDEPGGTDAAPSTTVDDAGGAFSDLTTPLHTTEEFVASLVAANPGFRVGASVEETTCAATAVVVALGGPEGLQSNSLTPEEFVNLGSLPDLNVPDDAADQFLETAVSCGFDPAEAVLLRHLDPSFFDIEACIRERLDRTLANEALARALFDAGGGFAIPPDLEVHLHDVSDACGGG